MEVVYFQHALTIRIPRLGAHVSKRIILLLDGTWNDADAKEGADTNIVRLREIIAKCLEPRPVPGGREALTPAAGGQQFSVTTRYSRDTAAPKKHLVFYERGVGTSGFLNAIAGGAFAVGLARNIRRGYIFLSRFYEPDDEIFIFGFSRGSYTVRSLVGYISAIGLLKCEYCTPANELKAWYYYRTTPADRVPSIAAELDGCIHPAGSVSIKCLGVFDTVGALGVPLPFFWRENRTLFEFHDVTLSRISEVNLHALAVDEHRESFEPTPWRQQKFSDVSTPTEQVWFAGAHADVGGGYLDEEKRKARNLPALDDITLDWMLRRVLHYCPDFPVRLDGKPQWPEIAPEWAIAPQHEARRSFYKAQSFALRSIGNCAVPTKRWSFMTNVCHDRHANPVGEMVHRSAIERLGCIVKIGKFESVYAPTNLLTTLDAIEATYAQAAQNGSEIRIVDWSGDVLPTEQATTIIAAARERLSLNSRDKRR